MGKRQLQDMLREMGVPYPSDATEETLAEILKNENRKQWMKSSASRGVKIKKKNEPKPHEAQRTAPKPVRGVKTESIFKRPIQRVGHKATSHRLIQKESHPPEASAPEPQKELEKLSPAEAAGICDLCEKSAHESAAKLTAYSFSDQVASRNLVALCPDCLAKVKTQGAGKDIRVLKRKARKRANANLQVSFAKVRNSWGYKPT
jgi:hypothetical protein